MRLGTPGLIALAAALGASAQPLAYAADSADMLRRRFTAFPPRKRPAHGRQRSRSSRIKPGALKYKAQRAANRLRRKLEARK